MTGRVSISTAVVFLVGAVAGALAVGIYNHLSARNAQETFEQHLRCRQLADEYVRKESDDTDTVFLRAVDYSRDSASCIASFETWEHISNTYTVLRWQVVNLLTADEIYGASCHEQTDCGDGNNIRIATSAQSAFDDAIRGRKNKSTKRK
jgi:hypothetical protein